MSEHNFSSRKKKKKLKIHCYLDGYSLLNSTSPYLMYLQAILLLLK